MTAKFARCYKLSSLNLSNFNTLLVKNMSYIFSNCRNMSILDISNFNTSNVVEMNYMFYDCYSLSSLNLSNFDTSKTKKMNSMFYNCSLIESLDLSNFDTSHVSDMNKMFYNCINLNILNISNLNTSNVNDMSNMFYNCSSLKTLNLSNFNTSYVYNLNDMFQGCQNLEYIYLDLKNPKVKMKDIIRLTHSNLIFCGIINENISLDLNLVSDKIIYCNDYKNIFNKYMCYMRNLTLYNDTSYLCEENFNMEKNKLINIGNDSFINCVDEEFCYFTCETCEIQGDETNNDCIKCKDEFELESNISNISNSKYKNCNKNETIQEIINNLLHKFNMTELDSGKDRKKIIDKIKLLHLKSYYIDIYRKSKK